MGFSVLRAGGAVVIVAAHLVGSPAATAQPAAPQVVVARTPDRLAAGASELRSTATGPPFAVAAGLRLLPPARKVVKYTYHESLFRTAMALRPRGRAEYIGNTRFRKPTDRRGPRYIVLPSRGRGTGAATAADIVLRRGARVLSPTDGRVTSVTDYRLYCATPDSRIIIKPRDRPGRRVVLFHVDRVVVERGDVVTAGESVIGRVRFFPNSRAQYDDFVGGDHPHVHVEVERRNVRPLPGCRG